MDPNDGETALHKAAKNGHLQACLVLVEHGASTSALDRRGNKPVSCILCRKPPPSLGSLTPCLSGSIIIFPRFLFHIFLSHTSSLIFLLLLAPMRVFIPPSLNASLLLFPPLSPPFSSVHPNPPPYFSPLFCLSRRPIASFHDPCFLMDDWCNPRSNSPSQTGTLRSPKCCSLPRPRRAATLGKCQFQHRACHHLSEAPRPTVRLRRFLPEEWLVRPIRLAAAAEVHSSSLRLSPM